MLKRSSEKEKRQCENCGEIDGKEYMHYEHGGYFCDLCHHEIFKENPEAWGDR